MDLTESAPGELELPSSLLRTDTHNRASVAVIAANVSDALSIINFNAERETVFEIVHLISEDPYRSLILGSFKVGKSTLINALLGTEILPSYVTPTTAVITEVKWADQPYAMLYFNDEKLVQPEYRLTILNTIL